MDSVEAFTDAFNARDLDALAACLAPDATAVVDGSPFPIERGRDAIRETSLAYMLDPGKGLTARSADHVEVHALLKVHALLLDSEGRLDVAIRIEQDEAGMISSLAYFTLPHRPDLFRTIAHRHGLDPAPE